MKPFACAAALVLLNAAVAWELFTLEYSAHMGSIEAAYIALSRYIMENWRDLTWFPLWYGGIPFQNAYPPLLHVGVAAWSALTGVSPASSHHAVTAALYVFGPVTLYCLMLRLSGRLAVSFAAGMLYSLLSTAALLLPAVARDMGSRLHARRLHALVHYGEGPHVGSMTLLPLAIVLLDVALNRNKPLWYLAAALGLSSVVLMNWLGGAALLVCFVALLIARRSGVREWARATGTGALAYAISAPWIPPSTLMAVRENAQRVGGVFTIGPRHLLYLAVAIVLACAVHFALRRASVAVRFFGISGAMLAGIVLAAHWAEVYVLPQPQRYHLEMEMALAPLAVLGAACLARRFPFWLRAAALALLFVAALLQFRTYRVFASNLIRPIDITSTSEYKAARWFEGNLAGSRVFAPGSISFWMNAWTDVPQLGGGFEQGIINPVLPLAQFQIYSGMNAGADEGRVAVLWLKALGVHAVAVTEPGSTEVYKPFANPRKFDGLLPVLGRDGGDVVYRVPQRSPSLVRVITRAGLPPRAPQTGLDMAPVEHYVNAVEAPDMPDAALTWHNRHRAELTGTLRPEHIISLQMSWHAGWAARVNGRAVSVHRDGLSQMYVEPGCNGECRVELAYTGGVEGLAARIVSAAAWIGMAVWAMVRASR